MRFWLNRGTQPEGPLEEAAIAQLIATGLRAANVCPEGGQAWQPLESHPPFAAALCARAAPAMTPVATLGGHTTPASLATSSVPQASAPAASAPAAAAAGPALDPADPRIAAHVARGFSTPFTKRLVVQSLFVVGYTLAALFFLAQARFPTSWVLLFYGVAVLGVGLHLGRYRVVATPKGIGTVLGRRYAWVDLEAPQRMRFDLIRQSPRGVELSRSVRLGLRLLFRGGRKLELWDDWKVGLEVRLEAYAAMAAALAQPARAPQLLALASVRPALEADASSTARAPALGGGLPALVGCSLGLLALASGGVAHFVEAARHAAALETERARRAAAEASAEAERAAAAAYATSHPRSPGLLALAPAPPHHRLALLRGCGPAHALPPGVGHAPARRLRLRVRELPGDPRRRDHRGLRVQLVARRHGRDVDARRARGGPPARGRERAQPRPRERSGGRASARRAARDGGPVARRACLAPSRRRVHTAGRARPHVARKKREPDLDLEAPGGDEAGSPGRRGGRKQPLPAGAIGPRPLVAIVGRPNVGKSTLFNRLARARIAIVEDVPGVTRDRHYVDTEIYGRDVVLVDTGGLDPESDDPMKEGIARHVSLALGEADVVVAVLDASAPPQPADRAAAALLRRAGKPVIWALNKADSKTRALEGNEHYELGMDRLIAISSLHGHGMDELEAAISRALPPPESFAGLNVDLSVPRVAIIGRPNAGKSSLINRLLGEDRQLVDARPGTTVDSIDTLYEKRGERYVLIDTAGIRRKRGIEETVEAIAVLKAIRSIERADAVVLLIDAAEGAAEQDARLLGLAIDRGRAVVIGLNKADLLDERARKKAVETARDTFNFAPWIPIVPLSAKTGRSVPRMLAEVGAALTERARRVPTAELNRFFEEVLEHHPPPTQRGRAVRIYYVTQAETKPPRFVVVANEPESVHFSYQRYVLNALRERFGFKGTPLRASYRRKNKKER